MRVALRTCSGAEQLMGRGLSFAQSRMNRYETQGVMTRNSLRFAQFY